MNIYQRYLARGDRTYYGRFSVAGKRYLRNLGTDNKEAAQKTLRTLFATAQAGRFVDLEASKARRNVATLAQLLTAYRAAALDIEPSTARHNGNALVNLLRASQPGEIEQLPCSVLTAAAVKAYQSACLSAGLDPLAQDRARTTANSTLRQARSVLAKKIRPSYSDLQLPDLAGFLSAAPLREPRQSYRLPPQDLVDRTWSAAGALRSTDPAAYVAFLLGAGLGLRKNEICAARWSWVREHSGRQILSIRTTVEFRPKGKDDRDVPIEEHVWTELQALRIAPLPGAPDPILVSTNQGKVFRRLSAWMQDLGWTTRKHAHELRKLYGSRVAMTHGLFAAQKLLGHKDPAVTSRYYAGLVELPHVKIFG